MEFAKTIAKHFHDVYYGGNWTSVNLKEAVSNVTHDQAIKKLYNLNSIADLVFHINYYVTIIRKVLEGGPLEGSDKLSFDRPAFDTEEEWQAFLNQVWENANALVPLIEALPDDELGQNFANSKYGTTHRNLTGLIEHTHYHLGQIVILRKILANK